MTHLEKPDYDMTRVFMRPANHRLQLKHMRSPFHSEAIVFPCHVNGNHWVLLVCHTRKKLVVVIDSFDASLMNTGPLKRRFWPHLLEKCILPLQRALEWQQVDKVADWTFTVTRRATLQPDNHSCGVHMASNLRDVVVRAYSPHAALGTTCWGHVGGD